MQNTLLMIAAGILCLYGQIASAQNFSCSYGKRAACLDYGDTVCSSSGMCVDRNASCFDSYQCNYEGFTCKSNLTECAEEYNEVVNDYNELKRKNGDLVDSYNELLRKAKASSNRLDEIESCLYGAENLDDARACAY